MNTESAPENSMVLGNENMFVSIDMGISNLNKHLL